MKKLNRIYVLVLKRLLDFLFSLFFILLLSPLFILLILFGFIFMKGNPFFVQKRAGKFNENNEERIFNLIKFRTMSNKKDEFGELLSDSERINNYGNLLRKTSLDELPELINILLGDMSFIGPRPLVISYLPYYNSFEHKRHSVRPGLTGLAQVNGRSLLNWPERFAFDIKYINELSFVNDFKILLKTFYTVVKRDNIAIRGTTNILDFSEFRIKENEHIIK